MNGERENFSMKQLLMKIASKFVMLNQDLMQMYKFQAISTKSL